MPMPAASTVVTAPKAMEARVIALAGDDGRETGAASMAGFAPVDDEGL
ncbi:hypothetical protein [Sphingomonas albertensis]|uniref:Uncharacterized protein n=1 Tax=Sphingomonas albertensis TaxID=2762591 RepID=A0ABR7AN41_9SPHN|nr:hypothetical protein [Sphingomonas albertensis]MBC3941880.1 hypothetical protein [Sphingomonas albertensis]